jgi:type IV pilus biogenesis protein CpaD/CtpE
MTPHWHLVVSIGAGGIGLLGMLAGCAATDPLLNPNLWRPSGINEANIAAEAADPADLVHGRQPASGTDGELAAAAVLRLRTGHVKALPDSAISDIHVQSAPTSGSAP